MLEVTFTNHLSEATSIHWHGLTLQAPMDGAGMVQAPIPPGGTFTCRYHLRDAGTFWYHPHVNEVAQLERGLYGTLVVRGSDEPVLDGERVLVLDVKLDAGGQVKPPGWWIEQHDRRQGGTRLVNGREEPEIVVAAGQVERWRIVNASSARYVRLSIGGRPIRILGTDGGLIEAPVTVTEAVMVPGDSLDFAVGPFGGGETFDMTSLRYDRRTLARPKNERFATIRVDAPQPSRAVIRRSCDRSRLSSTATLNQRAKCTSGCGRA